MGQPLINSSFLNGVADIIREHGASPQRYARRAGLAEDVFEACDRLIPYDQHTRLLELAACELNIPALGLAVAQRQTVSVFGPLFGLMTTKDTIEDSLQVFAKHLKICVQSLQLNIQYNGEIATIEPVAELESIDNSATFQDHALGLAWQLVQLLYGQTSRVRCNLRAAYFKHPAPFDSTAYTSFFNCPVAFDHKSSGLVMDINVLQAPISDDVKGIAQLVRHHLEKKHHQLADQVKDVIANLLITGRCNINDVAAAMGYSSRTLQRHLKAQDATFQSLIDAVRYQQAQTYLTNSYYRLTDVAALLGYSELSAFTRSFKRWFGLSPQQWRKQLAAADH